MFLVGYARIVLAILSFYFMPTDYIVATIMYLLSLLLDEFDGSAARYFNQCASPGFSIVLFHQFQSHSPHRILKVFHNTLFILNFLITPIVKIYKLS